jgi:hypothetical protein
MPEDDGYRLATSIGNQDPLEEPVFCARCQVVLNTGEGVNLNALSVKLMHIEIPSVCICESCNEYLRSLREVSLLFPTLRIGSLEMEATQQFLQSAVLLKASRAMIDNYRRGLTRLMSTVEH